METENMILALTMATGQRINPMIPAIIQIEVCNTAAETMDRKCESFTRKSNIHLGITENDELCEMPWIKNEPNNKRRIRCA